MIDNLLLLSGNDLPFPEAAITIHHPTLREIAYVGEDNFFNGYQLLNISKNLLTDEDKSNLDDLTNFDILIAILGERNAVMQKTSSPASSSRLDIMRLRVSVSLPRASRSCLLSAYLRAVL